LGGEVGGAALPLLSEELEEGARQEEIRQREKAKQIFISQVSPYYCTRVCLGFGNNFWTPTIRTTKVKLAFTRSVVSAI
jgi:hypothetical protein